MIICASFWLIPEWKEMIGKAKLQIFASTGKECVVPY